VLNEFEVELLGHLGAIRSGRRSGEAPEVIGGVGGAGQAADVGFAAAHDRAELGVTKGVPTELASCGQEGHPAAGHVVPVREVAVHLGRFEKLPIHEARTYHHSRTCVRLDACGMSMARLVAKLTLVLFMVS
jgi:hypothetical protein